ncbi:MAG: hypothetical protein AAGC81_02440 [Pseudomonadota bacterium]
MVKRLSDEKAIGALEAYERLGDMREAAAEIGISLSAFHNRVERGRALRALPGDDFEVHKTSVQTDGDGNVKSRSIKSRRQLGREHTVPDGMNLHRLSSLVDADGRVIQEWRIATRGTQSPGDMLEAFRREAESEIPRVPVIDGPIGDMPTDLLNLFPIADQHHGAYAWAPEAGEDYDLNISTRLLKSQLIRTFELTPRAQTAVILGLGDFFHTDTEKAETYYSGNSLDRDGRQGKVVLSGVKLIRWAVEEALKRHVTVHVVIKAGNHDPHAALMLAVMISIAFENNSRVQVDLDPSLFWYAEWGTTLLAATHGHTVKPKRFPAMMSTEAADAWGRAEFRHGFQGHIHHETTTAEEDGAQVYTFQTLAARDAWHAARYPRVGRSISSLTFHKELGRVNWATSPVPREKRADRVVQL